MYGIMSLPSLERSAHITSDSALSSTLLHYHRSHSRRLIHPPPFCRSPLQRPSSGRQKGDDQIRPLIALDFFSLWLCAHHSDLLANSHHSDQLDDPLGILLKVDAWDRRRACSSMLLSIVLSNALHQASSSSD